jgi:hypothetical protein
MEDLILLLIVLHARAMPGMSCSAMKLHVTSCDLMQCHAAVDCISVVLLNVQCSVVQQYAVSRCNLYFRVCICLAVVVAALAIVLYF